MGNPFDHWSYKEVEEILELPKLIPDRYSSLFVRQLKDGASGCHPKLDASKLIVEIKHLELGDESRNKPASQYTGPLSPLWHKHYTPFGIDISLKNLVNAHNIKTSKKTREKLESSLVNSTKSKSDADTILDFVIDSYVKTQAPLSEIPSTAVSKLSKRYQNKQGTGEWIIYAKHNGKNYYLCLAKHNDGDKNIRKLIKENCISEFPFLAELL